VAVTLSSISRRFVKRSLIQLRAYGEAAEAPVIACEKVHVNAKERLVLTLHDTWCQFAREYFLVSAFRRPLISSGERLLRAPGCLTAVTTLQRMRIVMGRPKSANWDPKWHIPNELIGLATALDLQNHEVIVGVLGLPQVNVLSDLTAVRNAIAHRDRRAVARYDAFVTKVGFRVNVSPAALMNDSSYYGARMFEHWVSVLQYVAETLA